MAYNPRDKGGVGLRIENVPMSPEIDDPRRIRRKPIFNLVQDDPRKPYGTRPDVDSLPLDHFQSPPNALSFTESFAWSPKSPPQPALLSASSFQSTLSDASTQSYNADPHSRLLGSTSYPNSPDPRVPSPSRNLTFPNFSIRGHWWNMPWMMYLLFILGVCGALGHHAFYSSLAGTEAHNQLQMLRYGAAIAYFTKASLAASLVLAFRQQIWATFRRKFLSINAIDSLFSGIGDLDALLNLEVFQKAKAAIFLILLLWLAPLTVILAPATLFVQPSLLINHTTCPNVRTLNFTPESTNEWRKPNKIIGLYELSLSFWNTTSYNTSDPNFFDYYTTPSQPIQQTATLSGYLQNVIARPDASVDVCGQGWNCSFTVDFTGPGYKCTSFADGDIDLDGPTVGTPPFNSSVLVPKGNFSYYVLADIGDYAPIQVESGDAGIPTKSPFPPNLGVFRTEPVLWVGHTTLKNPNATLPSNSSDPAYATAFQSHLFFCEHYETNYIMRFNYSAGSQMTSIVNRTFLAPIINTTFVPGRNANDGTKDNTTAVPFNNYIYPIDKEKYRLTAAYHSLGATLRQFINSTIDFQNPNSPITKTPATTTRLIDKRTYLAFPDLMGQVQSFYEDIILSLFSNPQFLVVAWATDPSKSSGTQSGGAGGLYPCTKSRMRNVFVYKVRDLWLIYGSIIVLAGLGVLLGAAAIYQNGGGHMRDIRFSSIVAATRAPCLDQLDWKRHNGESEGQQDIGNVRLGYGQVRAGLGTPHVAGETEADYRGFGLEGEVRQGFASSNHRRASIFSFVR
ncbi:uncharacterized protein PAC_18093 [Phialocephala subalpina]|uniref:Uncharacterized protein n=1 Tax=Phialocephala subalpina TaxID=576137 RepID=A0A1L7XT16_9HELO|nr:uncharacterized protein PAC_18093 [Phialocephala subalpina]